MRFAEPAQSINPAQQIIGYTVDDLTHLPVHVGVKSTEIGHARSGPHATEKSIALDQQYTPPRATGRDGGGDTSRPAAQHDHFVVAVDLDLARGLGNCPHLLIGHVRSPAPSIVGARSTGARCNDNSLSSGAASSNNVQMGHNRALARQRTRVRSCAPIAAL